MIISKTTEAGEYVSLISRFSDARRTNRSVSLLKNLLTSAQTETMSNTQLEQFLKTFDRFFL